MELVDVRNRFARSLGYDNYGEYAFPNLYGRDYSVEEGILYCQEALGNLGPLSARLNVVADPDIDPEAVNEVMSDLTGQEMVDLVRPNMEKVSGELAELFQYMLDNELLDTEPLDSKLFSAFTEALPAYDSAYLFFHPDYLDAYTLVHEFGHFADFCLAPDVIPCYDILEIHSQGLETLYFSFADELVGEENAASLRQYWLSALLDSGVVNGAVVAAFELEAYTKGDMTLEELNRYYGQLSEAAGFDTYYDDAAYGWYGIPHLFTSPCYYLSYSTSAASALDLLLLSQEDFVRAADVYLNLVAQREVYGYRDAAEAVGLTNMLEPGALTDLAAGLEEYIYDQVWEVEPFSDVPENSWAYRDVMAAVAGGMLSAEKEGIFAPDRAMNGQELSAAMNWFATETGEEWSVASEDVVTREELILACIIVPARAWMCLPGLIYPGMGTPGKSVPRRWTLYPGLWPKVFFPVPERTSCLPGRKLPGPRPPQF